MDVWVLWLVAVAAFSLGTLVGLAASGAVWP